MGRHFFFFLNNQTNDIEILSSKKSIAAFKTKIDRFAFQATHFTQESGYYVSYLFAQFVNVSWPLLKSFIWIHTSENEKFLEVYNFLLSLWTSEFNVISIFGSLHKRCNGSKSMELYFTFIFKQTVRCSSSQQDQVFLCAVWPHFLKVMKKCKLFEETNKSYENEMMHVPLMIKLKKKNIIILELRIIDLITDTVGCVKIPCIERFHICLSEHMHIFICK